MTTPATQLSRRTFLRFCAAGAVGLAAGKFRPGVISAGLDIGTSSICVAVGESRPDRRLHILGIGEAISQGITRHGIVNIKEAEACICEALVQAEAASGVMITRIILGVIGTKITPNGDGPGWDRIFSSEEPCYIDAGHGLLRPLEISSEEGSEHKHSPSLPMDDVTVVAGVGSRIQALSRCLVAAGVEIKHAILPPAATACLTLNLKQQKQGALVIDLGTGTTDYAVYVGGRLIVADCLARGLQDMEFDASIGSTFRFIRCRLEARHIRMDSLREGVHLAGGGALQPRVLQAAREVFGLKAQVGMAQGIQVPANMPGLSPRHLAAVGLIHWHQNQLHQA